MYFYVLSFHYFIFLEIGTFAIDFVRFLCSIKYSEIVLLHVLYVVFVFIYFKFLHTLIELKTISFKTK